LFCFVVSSTAQANVMKTPDISVETSGIAGGQRSILDKVCHLNVCALDLRAPQYHMIAQSLVHSACVSHVPPIHHRPTLDLPTAHCLAPH
jgi:hypothetical protein